VASTFLHQGATISHDLHGSRGPRVLLIHGVGVAGCGWRPQVEALRERCRVLTFDNRGLGQSSRPRGAALSVEQMAGDAFALAQSLGWNSCHVIGHSMGGVIAQSLALQHPEFIESLALLCAVAKGADAARLTWPKLWLGLRGRIGTRCARRRAFLQMVLAPEEFAAANVEQTAALFADVFGRDLADQPAIAFAQLRATARYDARPHLPSLVNTRAIVISAEHDIIAPPQGGRELASLIPGARFLELRGTAHAATITRAVEVNRHLSEWLLA
jgi:pimeloyl-ACP methyl ester carboxylesterase